VKEEQTKESSIRTARNLALQKTRRNQAVRNCHNQQAAASASFNTDPQKTLFF
jgi:hypothetical protein